MSHISALFIRYISCSAVGCLLMALFASQSLLAQDTESTATADGEDYDTVLEEVVVKGFRASLQQAVALKRDAVNTRDSIVTEDICKMPDLNLA